MNNIGGKIIIINIRKKTSWEITKSLKDISSRVTPTVICIARRVKSLPFVTDVR
jgi:ubiquinone/menaquinone biosynthesis C-methylase UbiE